MTIQLSADPDFTGFPLSPGDPPAFWRLTREQWYLIARAVMREGVRGHWEMDPTRALVLDDATLATVAYNVRQLLASMRDDPAWAQIAWGQRIPWAEVGCYAQYQLEHYPLQYSEFRGVGCSEVWADASYLSGLALWGAALDAVQPYANAASEARYEVACDEAWNAVFAATPAGLEQAATPSSDATAGDAYNAPPVTVTSVSRTVLQVGIAAAVGGLAFNLLAWSVGWTGRARVAASIVGAVAGGIAGAT
jgi:hypothetical protein